MTPSIDPWEHVTDLLLTEARFDLEDHGESGLYVAAAAGREPLFVATSRPFPKGSHVDPIVELWSLAALMGADRFAVAVTGRAWSFDDPIVPVTQDADLRQRVLCINACDGHGRTTPVLACTLHPFDLVGRDVAWHEPLDLGRPEGWFGEALPLLVAERGRAGRSTPAEVGAQFERCLRLGHNVGLAPGGGARLLPWLEERAVLR